MPGTSLVVGFNVIRLIRGSKGTFYKGVFVNTLIACTPLDIHHSNARAQEKEFQRCRDKQRVGENNKLGDSLVFIIVAYVTFRLKLYLQHETKEPQNT